MTSLNPKPFPQPSAKYWRVAIGVACLMGVALAQAQTLVPSGPLGRWVTANGNLEVDIAACGQALCGTVTRVLGNRSMSRDGAEMDPVDKRPALGMTLLHDFVPMTDHESGERLPQWQGAIYNRENGKTYPCQMSVSTAHQPAGELILHAYVGLPLFGRTQIWQRVASHVQAASQSD